MADCTYDYLIVGSGFFGATAARVLADNGKKVLVIDKRGQVGGNCASYIDNGIDVHLYGAHIFCTNNEKVWKFINRFSKFNNFINTPLAYYKDKLYNLPFNMHTFYQLFGAKTPNEAKAALEKERAKFSHIKSPKNLEEQALFLGGEKLYKTLIKGYTEKQWGRECKDLPASILNRLPFRYSFNNNYFSTKYQGIPVEGYNALFTELLSGIEVRLNCDYFTQSLKGVAKKTIFSGKVDEFFGFKLGKLEYRSLKFETEKLELENYQGVAVVNYTDTNPSYTRIIEHKHFRADNYSPITIITKEYPQSEGEPYYVINDEKNNALYAKYKALADREKGIIFGGRLAEYKYYNMDGVILSALEKAEQELKGVKC